ncbi:hypothetical protein P7K49_020462, partial [Saguinus oedipus]
LKQRDSIVELPELERGRQALLTHQAPGSGQPPDHCGYQLPSTLTDTRQNETQAPKARAVPGQFWLLPQHRWAERTLFGPAWGWLDKEGEA